MNFRTINDMDMLIRANLHRIPEDVELVVGVPRSGMLPATLLAVYLNLPLTDSMSLLSENNHAAASRSLRQKGKSNTTNIKDYKKILIMDDSCNTGLSINELKQEIAQIEDCSTEIIYGCVYAAPNAVQYVDLYFEVLHQPRVFEWNIMNHGIIERACLDLDGVLCIDPTNEQNDDGEKYIEFIKNAIPLWIPKFTIGAIVTSRLEKYRKETASWLDQHGVKYKNLIMLDLPTKEDRIRMGAHAPFKASIYNQIKGSALFIESDPAQAKFIANSTGKAVYCVSNNAFYDEENHIDQFLTRKQELDNYRNKIADILESVVSLGGHLANNGGDDEGLLDGIIAGLNATINLMTKIYPRELCEGLITVAEKLDKNRGKGDLSIEQLDTTVGACLRSIDKWNHNQLTQVSSMVSSNEWTRELKSTQERVFEFITDFSKEENEYKEEVEYLRDKGKLQMYPYKWTEEYDETSIEVHSNEYGIKYVIHDGKPLYLLQYSDELARSEYNQLIVEQDRRSPHRYFDDKCDFQDGDIFVDVGAAEGIISLDVLEKASEIYLIECSDNWIRALKETFRGHMDKVHIISKYAGDEDSDNSTTLDSLLSKYKNKRIFIKMDIEGMEMDALSGAKTTIKNNICHLSIATYHMQNQAEEVMEFFNECGYDSYPSEGYVLFLFGRMVLSNGKYERLEPPFFRRALVRAVPKQQ